MSDGKTAQRPAWLPPPPDAPEPAPVGPVARPTARRGGKTAAPAAKQGKTAKAAAQAVANDADLLKPLLDAPLILDSLPGAPQAAPQAGTPVGKGAKAELSATTVDADVPLAADPKTAALAAMNAGRTEEAVVHFRRHLAKHPEDHSSLSNLGVAYRKLGRAAIACAIHGRACKMQPENGSYWSNYGNALKDADRIAEAVAAQRHAVTLDERQANWWHNLGVTLREAGEFEESLEAFERAIRLAPQRDNMRWDRSVLLLHLGRWEEGWIAYDWRYRLGELPERTKLVPRWLGERFEGQRILLHPEQGFGDTLFALRYLPMVKERGGEVILMAKQPLLRLVQGTPGADYVLPTDTKAVPRFHYVASLMDLMRVFMPTPETAPPPARLVIPEAARQKARQWLAPLGDAFKVGIVWSGSITFKNNQRRATDVERFLPLSEVPDVALVSLQKGPREHELETSGADAVMLDVGRKVKDFAETAAVIEQLDLVVMTDSSVAHLCGSLGKPVWNLLNYVPYWLYGWDSDETPWYPSMRLYRQPDIGDWDSVFAQVIADLGEAVLAKREGRWPAVIAAAS